MIEGFATLPYSFALQQPTLRGFGNQRAIVLSAKTCQATIIALQYVINSSKHTSAAAVSVKQQALHEALVWMRTHFAAYVLQTG